MFEANKKTLRNVFIGVISCIVLYWVLSETEKVGAFFAFIGNILSPFVVGAAIAFIINVPMRGIENGLKAIKKPVLRRIIALVLTFIVVLLVLALVFILLIPQLSDTVTSLIPKLYAFASDFQVWLEGFLADHPELTKMFSGGQSLDWSSLVQNAVTMLTDSVSAILAGAFLAIGSVAGFIFDLFIAIVFAVYCLFQKETLARQGRKLLYAFFPEKFSDGVIRILRLSNTTFSNFLSGQCLEVCILGSLFAISMAIFGMPYIPLVSVLVAVTAFIPVVGAWIGCIFGAFFILVEDPMLAVWFVVMFIVLQQIENNMIYPRVVGTSIGLSGMWVLVAVAVGGDLFGVAGMLLMIPFASVLYTLLQELTRKRLDIRNVSPDKLTPQPPVLSTFLKPKKQKNLKSNSDEQAKK